MSSELDVTATLATTPDKNSLTNEFIRNYYRNADQLFLVLQGETTFADLSDLGFDFDIYASGEYSRMLEKEWA